MELEEHIVDFDSIETWKDIITGDELFSAMGTTIKKDGNKETQYKIDFTYQYEVAKAAYENGVEKYILVSSAGANPRARNFYLRIKGDLKKAPQNLHSKVFYFQTINSCWRTERKRIGEKIGISIAKSNYRHPSFSKKYRPIEGETVADAMINSANDVSHARVMIYSLDQIFHIAE